MSTLEVQKTKSPFGAEIKADATGALPTEIEILKAGVWRTLWHGDFMVAPEDLFEYVDNFNAAVGLADNGSKGAPIDFGHESDKLAAGWIKALRTDGQTLYGTVKWSKAGTEALLGDEFAFFSPEFYPKGRGGWPDPENYEYEVDNVLTGGGLTNIPLFKALGAVKASAGGKHGVEVNVEYINASEFKENQMTVQEQIAEYRKTEVAKLSEEQKAFVTAHATELTDDDKTHFGLESGITAAAQAALDAKNKNTGDDMDPEIRQIAADIKAGKSVVISASVYQKMQDEGKASQTQIDELRRDKISAHVDSALARGAIKADRKDKWVDRIMADATFQEELDSLPDNGIMAAAQGSSTKAGDATGAATTELHEKTVAHVKASSEKGIQLGYVAAQREVLASNTDLAKKINESKEQ